MPRLDQLSEMSRKTLLAHPVIDNEATPWTVPRKPLRESRLALVTTAGLHRRGDAPFVPRDQTDLDGPRAHRAREAAARALRAVSLRPSARGRRRPPGTAARHPRRARAARPFGGSGARGLRRRALYLTRGAEPPAGRERAVGADGGRPGGRDHRAAPLARVLAARARRANRRRAVGRRPAPLPRRRPLSPGLRGGQGRGASRIVGRRPRPAVHPSCRRRPQGLLLRVAHGADRRARLPGGRAPVLGRDPPRRSLPAESRPHESVGRPRTRRGRVRDRALGWPASGSTLPAPAPSSSTRSTATSRHRTMACARSTRARSRTCGACSMRRVPRASWSRTRSAAIARTAPWPTRRSPTPITGCAPA